VPAIIWSAHGGQEYGNALADVLFGDEDPGGRLTQTWYRSAAELPELVDYDVIATDSTYMYFRGTPLYPFGHGLSYARFIYSDLTLSSDDLRPDETLTVSVTITNTGWRPGEEVVQVYTRQQRSRVKQPLRRLRGFQKVVLGPGESRQVSVHIPVSDLAFWDITRGRFVVEDTTHKIQVGRSSRDVSLGASFTVKGERIPPRDVFSRPVNAVDHDEYDGIVLCDGAGGAVADTGDAVCSVEAGAWILFRQVDLGHGAAECVLTGGTPASRAGGLLALRVDDPLFGEVIGTFTVPFTAAGHVARVRGRLAKATGVRDVYLVFEDAEVTVRQFELLR
jgi:beta-glucosidase